MQKLKINVYSAIGKKLAYDVTAIEPGKFKGPLFKKGHIIKKSDIKKLLKAGKDNIWVLKLERDEIHEEDAAVMFKKLAGKNVSTSNPQEGKINFIAQKDGVFVVDSKIVYKINHIRDILFVTRHSYIPVKKDEKLGGIRIIPLATKKNNVEKVLKFEKCLNVFEYKKKEAGVIITGNEVYYGRIKDKFKPVVEEKLKEFGSVLKVYKILPDDKELLKKTILEFSKICDLIILTGGMSVDADDVTNLAIKEAGVKIVKYGVPILPGNMLCIGYLKEIPVIGVPACAIYSKTTSFDVFLPLILADIKITKDIIISKSYGGFCLNCKVCTYPYCAFGK